MLRNAGAVVTDDTLRSLAISQHVLGTSDVHLVGHTACGLAGTTDDELSRRVRDTTGHTVDIAWGTFRDLEARVRAGVHAIVTCPFLRPREVFASILDTETGALHDVPLTSSGERDEPSARFNGRR